MLAFLGLLFWGSATATYAAGEKVAFDFKTARENRITHRWEARAKELINKIGQEEPDYFKTCNNMSELYAKSGRIYKQLQAEGMDGRVLCFHTWFRETVRPYCSMEHRQISYYINEW